MADQRDEAVTQWIERLKGGDEQAAEHLFRHYYDRACRLARKHLRDVPCREKDEEDMVLSAFESLFCGARAGQYNELHDRDEFWRLMHKICICKVRDQIRRLGAQKRAAEVGESALGNMESRGFAGIAAVPGMGQTPDHLAEVAENIARLLELLPDSRSRMIAVLKAARHTNAEIANTLDCSETTIERYVRKIKALWSQELTA